jgi:mono/diheme cytochrome c family protein
MLIRKSTALAVTTVLAASVSLFAGGPNATAPQEKEQKELKKVPMPYSKPESGKQMFKDYCAVCHGANGKGDGPAVEFLKVPPPDLGALAKGNNGKYPEDRVAATLRLGVTSHAHGTPDMPLWGTLFRSRDGSVSELRIHNLTDYLQTLQEK